MTTQRALSPFETGYFGTGARLGSVPLGGMPLYIGSTVRGEIDPALLREALAELAAGHALLRAHLVSDADGALRFELTPGFRPALEVAAGGEAAYRALVNSEQDWHDGLFKAIVLREEERTQIVLILHHGISDGRSAFALLDELWRRYSAHLAGSPLPPHDSDTELVDGVDAQLRQVVSDAEVAAFVAQIREAAFGMDPAAAPRPLPPAGNPDPLGRFALRRIELSAGETAAFVSAARAHGVSVNSLLAGAATLAVRTQFGDIGPVPMMCGHAVDLRPELVAPLPDSTVLNCAAGAGTPLLVDIGSDPIELAQQVAAGMREALAMRFPALFMRAAQGALDPVASAVFAAQPTIALSNIGRVPEHSLPPRLELLRDDVFAMVPGMPPKMTVFTVGDRLTIQVEYDTADHGHVQMGVVAAAMRSQVLRLCEPARQRV
ncbi:phthiocerol/phthiodiolone dimycocerosyl transferase family protein [Nocardia huaxiensis]|uniref:phthiocerol/phthiodiolone dimycocerosyl transferase family protein n=1 Tax=Nocardia huaxiensis TaxID=2755382 RepID=UPI001E555077|nr:hypothetical protein [Nocardia huaxiensis]UFS98172.1 hypothetical protein LPY97_09885 [Nocardia huaxiensis]